MKYLLIIFTLFITSCNSFSQNSNTKKESKTCKIEKISKSEKEWKKQLSDIQYNVTREGGTERAFTGIYWDNKKSGSYNCIGCDLPLFSSDTKFESGTGWPSFWKPINDCNVAEKVDNKYGMKRIEVVCNRCESHLGHIFEDGPKPTGLRYCLNSASLKFVNN